MPGLPEAEAASLDALTASSQLTRLNLCGTDLPRGAGRHMLPPGRQLPLLRELAVSSGCEWEAMRAGVDLAEQRPLGEADLGRLAAVCPGLERLHIESVLDGTLQLEPLQQLSRLTALAVGGAEVDNAAAERVLSRLSRLQELQVVSARDFGMMGLAHLASLTRLTRFCVVDCGLGLEEGEEPSGPFAMPDVRLESEASPRPSGRATWRRVAPARTLARCCCGSSCGSSCTAAGARRSAGGRASPHHTAGAAAGRAAAAGPWGLRQWARARAASTEQPSGGRWLVASRAVVCLQLARWIAAAMAACNPPVWRGAERA